MSTVEAKELAEVMNRVRGWSITSRIRLARGILDSLLSAPASDGLTARNGNANSGPPERLPRGPSAAEVMALFKTDKPPPDDATVERGIEEHLMEKYG